MERNEGKTKVRMRDKRDDRKKLGVRMRLKSHQIMCRNLKIFEWSGLLFNFNISCSCFFQPCERSVSFGQEKIQVRPMYTRDLS